VPSSTVEHVHPRLQCHRLDILVVNAGRRSKAQERCCAPSTCLSTDSLCLPADPLGFEDPVPTLSADFRTAVDMVVPQLCGTQWGALLFPCQRLPGLQTTAVPPPVLQTPLLPWTILKPRPFLVPLSSSISPHCHTAPVLTSAVLPLVFLRPSYLGPDSPAPVF
jgi:hypothetical protein